MNVDKSKTINILDNLDYRGQTEKIAQVVTEHLDTIGYVVIKNFIAANEQPEESAARFLNLSEMIGKAVAHDSNGKLIWDIKSNPNSASIVKTYSEHSHEAELHTDSQYSENPEDCFGLLTLVPATCGGGLSLLLSLKAILSELRKIDTSGAIEDTLRNTSYPFIVPNVFKKSTSNEPEFNFAPILRDNEIRFRVDTFEKALTYKADLCTEVQRKAFETLKNLILHSPSIHSFMLERGDLIFINNKTMLHGRTQFEDLNRHLLRVRMQKTVFN